LIEGDTLRGEMGWDLLKGSGEISSSSEKLDKIMANADVLISGINNVLDEKAQEDLRSSR
jgi:phospholipid/cholesterol/gamma-HCH transport system substrate-binding protein